MSLGFVLTLLGYPKPTRLIGRIQTHITFYAQKSDKYLWNHTGICPKFTETAMLYTISGQSSANFALHTPIKVISCVFDNEVDVSKNTCIVRRAKTFSIDEFKSTLNYPVEISIELTPGQTVVVDGFPDQNDLFHVIALSNYDI